MKKLAIAACFAVLAFAPALVSAEATGSKKATHTPTAQQQKMKDCNAQAKEKHLKGKEHKTFMSNCLKGKSAM